MGRDQLEDILNRQEYQAYYEDHRSIWKVLYDWFIGFIQDLLEKLFPALQSTPNVAGFIATIIVVVLVIILIFIMINLWQKRKFKRSYEQSAPLSTIHELKWTYKDHFKKAREREELGDYKLSIRHYFLGLLLFYDEIKWLKAEIWKTNWEYYMELKKRTNKEADSFNSLAKTFDAVTYGRRKVSKEQFLVFKEIVEGAYQFAREKESMEEGK